MIAPKVIRSTTLPAIDFGSQIIVMPPAKHHTIVAIRQRFVQVGVFEAGMMA